MKKILVVFAIIFANFFAEIVHAEMQTYEGKDVAMFDFGEDDAQIVATVKNIAKNRAIQAAREKAGVYIQSFSRMVNGVLTDDDISAVTNNISEILDVKYEKDFFNAVDAKGNSYGQPGVLYQAIVTVKIDTSGITEYLQKDSQEKAKIIQQNKNLQSSLVEAEGNFEDTRSNAKTKSVAEIKAELQKVDKELSAAEKISEGNKFAYQKNYSAAAEKYNEAIEINSSSVYAQENLEITEGKEILPDSNNAKYFYNRGIEYFNSKDYERALVNFRLVIRFEPNFQAAYRYKEICEQKISENKKFNKTTNKSTGGKKSKLEMNKPKRKNSVLEDTFGLVIAIAGVIKK